MPEREVVVRAEKVAAKYSAREVFSGVEFSLRAGQAIAIMGESGVGKSTLLHAIAGAIGHAGTIEVAGTVIPNGGTQEPNQNVVLVTQQANLWSHLTALDNVALIRRLLHKEERAVAIDYALCLLRNLECDDVATRFPHSLSGGEQQRISLARGLATEKSLILLDEVTSNIDSDRKVVVIEALKRRMRDGASVILVSHDVNLGLQLGARTLTMTPTGLVSSFE